MSRKHRDCSVNVLCGLFKDSTFEGPSTSEYSLTSMQETASVSNTEDTVWNECEVGYLYLRNVCMFYKKKKKKKLQGQHLIPPSTIENRIENC